MVAILPPEGPGAGVLPPRWEVTVPWLWETCQRGQLAPVGSAERVHVDPGGRTGESRDHGRIEMLRGGARRCPEVRWWGGEAGLLGSLGSQNDFRGVGAVLQCGTVSDSDPKHRKSAFTHVADQPGQWKVTCRARTS